MFLWYPGVTPGSDYRLLELDVHVFITVSGPLFFGLPSLIGRCSELSISKDYLHVDGSLMMRIGGSTLASRQLLGVLESAPGFTFPIISRFDLSFLWLTEVEPLTLPVGFVRLGCRQMTWFYESSFPRDP